MVLKDVVRLYIFFVIDLILFILEGEKDLISVNNMFKFFGVFFYFVCIIYLCGVKFYE